MKEEIKQAVETIVNHPKSSVVITGLFTSNVWLDYGEPLIKGLTSIFGLGVIILLFIKHFLDIKASIFPKNNETKDN